MEARPEGTVVVRNSGEILTATRRRNHCFHWATLRLVSLSIKVSCCCCELELESLSSVVDGGDTSALSLGFQMATVSISYSWRCFSMAGVM